jgi:Zn-dependent protease with chaperone function
MNFFAEQERARRNTLVLIGLMTAAVASLILMTALAIGAALHFIQQPMDSHSVAINLHTSWREHFVRMLQSDILYYAAAGVLVVVVGGSIFKSLQLRGSGRRVAEALGGRLILPNTHDAMERKILNVVEEMAIASGNPVPPVYLLDEPGINAFAAGTDRRNAVIGVTRGCIELLNRDELQGVMAHEFSHIHNGDMRLNLRLVSILHGILLISLIGSMLLRSSARHNRKNQGAQLGLGLAFVVLGYCGLFFGNLIKAAVSRQREFLADASAVQFTRNPTGIANALKKIGGHSEHALLQNSHAAEFSHLYFSQGVGNLLGFMLATHPPLPQRIRKIQPRWDGTKIIPQRAAAAEQAASTPNAGKPDAMAAGVSMMAAVAEVGNITPEQIDAAQVFLLGLPERIHTAAHEPFSCRALILWLLMDRSGNGTQHKQWQLLRESLDQATLTAMEELRYEMDSLTRADNLRVLDLALPALKTLSANQYQVFKKEMILLIKADDEISLFEWCLYRIVTSGYENKVRNGAKRLSQVQGAVQTLLIAACRDLNDLAFTGAIAAAEKQLGSISLQKEANRSFSIAALESALKQLEQLRPLDKPLLLKALAAAMESDGEVKEEEVELFRAIADCLDCPVPPLSAGKRPADIN